MVAADHLDHIDIVDVQNLFTADFKMIGAISDKRCGVSPRVLRLACEARRTTPAVNKDTRNMRIIYSCSWWDHLACACGVQVLGVWDQSQRSGVAHRD